MNRLGSNRSSNSIIKKQQQQPIEMNNNSRNSNQEDEVVFLQDAIKAIDEMPTNEFLKVFDSNNYVLNPSTKDLLLCSANSSHCCVEEQVKVYEGVRHQKSNNNNSKNKHGKNLIQDILEKITNENGRFLRNIVQHTNNVDNLVLGNVWYIEKDCKVIRKQIAQHLSTHVGSSNNNSAKKFTIGRNPNDVLLGRGGRSNHHPGNMHLRSLIRERMPLYMHFDKIGNKKEKTGLSQDVVDKIVKENNGRFLSCVDNDLNLWYIEKDIITIRNKVSQYFRDIIRQEKKGKKKQIMKKEKGSSK